MKDVSQYPVEYGFGLTKPTPPWSKDHPHLGVDRPTPIGTPLIVNGQLIGYTGNTGGVKPHHHLQKVQNGQVVDPKTDGFIIPSPAVVFSSDTIDDTNIGKNIRIRDANGVEWSHFHLSEILVKTGDQIGVAMVNDQDIINIYNSVLAVEPSEQEKAAYRGKDFKHVFNDIYQYAIQNKRDYFAYKAANKPVNAVALKPGVYEVKPM